VTAIVCSYHDVAATTTIVMQNIVSTLFYSLVKARNNTYGLFGLAYSSLSTGIKMCETIWDNL